MTAAEIAQRLASGPRTPQRERLAKVLCERSKVSWADVEAALRQPIPKVRAQRQTFRSKERKAHAQAHVNRARTPEHDAERQARREARRQKLESRQMAASEG